MVAWGAYDRAGMRLLFVSSTTVGGSGRSQRELAARLRARGHEVELLVDDDRPARVERWAYGHLSDLAARLRGRPGGRFADWLARRPGWRMGRLDLDGTHHRTSVAPENALARVLDTWMPDVVVANSLERLGWRTVHEVSRRRDVPTVLYIRETDSLHHLELGEVPDLLVANAESLQATLVAQGFSCAFVPSVIDVDVTRTESRRAVALAINPIPSRGSALVWTIAEGAPEIPVVAQESWPLEGRELADVLEHVASLPNLEFRRAAPPGPALYGDARVLLVPYLVDNRPRVIAEAQANGIPVIAADIPALREAIGAGGLTVPLDDPAAWVDALRAVWSDAERYDQLVRAAREHSVRPEIDPDAVAAAFEHLVTTMLDARRGARRS